MLFAPVGHGEAAGNQRAGGGSFLGFRGQGPPPAGALHGALGRRPFSAAPGRSRGRRPPGRRGRNLPVGQPAGGAAGRIGRRGGRERFFPGVAGPARGRRGPARGTQPDHGRGPRCRGRAGDARGGRSRGPSPEIPAADGRANDGGSGRAGTLPPPLSRADGPLGRTTPPRPRSLSGPGLPRGALGMQRPGPSHRLFFFFSSAPPNCSALARRSSCPRWFRWPCSGKWAR